MQVNKVIISAIKDIEYWESGGGGIIKRYLVVYGDVKNYNQFFQKIYMV